LEGGSQLQLGISPQLESPYQPRFLHLELTFLRPSLHSLYVHS